MGDVGDSFIRTLVEDVQAALERCREADSEGHRREAIRTIFAAIEGITWIYREHIRKVAKDVGALSATANLALLGQSYAIGSQGDVVEHARHTPLPALIRFIAKTARETCEGPIVDFGHVGWGRLQDAIFTRNRLTHPKTRADLKVTAQEVEIAQGGFLWLLALAIEGMAAANQRLTSFTEDAHEIIEELRCGDPDALEEYRRAAAQIDDD